MFSVLNHSLLDKGREIEDDLTKDMAEYGLMLSEQNGEHINSITKGIGELTDNIKSIADNGTSVDQIQNEQLACLMDFKNNFTSTLETKVADVTNKFKNEHFNEIRETFAHDKTFDVCKEVVVGEPPKLIIIGRETGSSYEIAFEDGVIEGKELDDGDIKATYNGLNGIPVRVDSIENVFDNAIRDFLDDCGKDIMEEEKSHYSDYAQNMEDAEVEVLPPAQDKQDDEAWDMDGEFEDYHP